MSISEKFTLKQKEDGRRLINRAVENKILDKPCKCEICKQDKGIIEYYISDYRPQFIIKSVRALCWTCHRMLLLKKHFPRQSKEYFENVLGGITYKEVENDDPRHLSKLGIGIIYYYAILGDLKWI